MTDREIIEACAAAMNLQGGWREDMPFLERGLLVFMAEAYDSPQTAPYNPLRFDAQAMALVKRFRMDVYALFGGEEPLWEAVGTIAGWDRTKSNDLNRAICECVAKWSHMTRVSGD